MTKVISAIAFVRDYDVGEEDWHEFLAFAEGTSDETIQAAILAHMQAQMAEWGADEYRDLTMADMDIDGRICWQYQTLDIIA